MHVIANLLYHTAELVAQGQWHFFVGDRVRRRRHYVGTAEIFVEIYILVVSTKSRIGSLRSIPVPHMPTYAGFTYRDQSRCQEIYG